MDIDALRLADQTFSTDRFNRFAFNPFARGSDNLYSDPRELARQQALQSGGVESTQGVTSEASPAPPATGYAFTGQLNAQNYPTLSGLEASLSQALGLSDASQSPGIGGMRGTAALTGNNIGNIGAQVGIGLLSSLLGVSAPLAAVNQGMKFSGKETLTQQLANLFAPSNALIANIAEQTNTPVGLQAIAAAMQQADAQALENNPGLANPNAMAAVNAFNDAMYGENYAGGTNNYGGISGGGAFGGGSLSDAVSGGDWGGSADSDV